MRSWSQLPRQRRLCDWFSLFDCMITQNVINGFAFYQRGARPKWEVINFWKCSRSRTFWKDSLSQHFGSYLHKYISNWVKKKNGRHCLDVIKKISQNILQPHILQWFVLRITWRKFLVLVELWSLQLLLLQCALNKMYSFFQMLCFKTHWGFYVMHALCA